MLSKTDARDLLTFKFPGSLVESGVDFDGFWVFRAFLPIGGGEEKMNPFFSIDKTTGVVHDFSVIACSNPIELARLFAIEDALVGT